MNYFKLLMATVAVLSFTTLSHAGKSDYMEKDSFTVTASNGKSLHVRSTKKGLLFDSGKGKVTLLVLWTRSCTSCKAWLGDMNAIQRKYAGKVNVVAVEISDMSNKDLNAYRKGNHLDYPLLSGVKNNDFTSQAMAKFLFDQSLPFTVVLGPQGQTNGITKGISDTTQYENYIGKIVDHYTK